MAPPRKYHTDEERLAAKRARQSRWIRANPRSQQRKRREREGERIGVSKRGLMQVRIPQYVLDDRARRAAMDLNPNQLVLGDPLPGYSARDRRL